MTSGSCEVDRERASERASERPTDRTVLRYGFVRRRARLLKNRDFLHVKFNARIPAIVAALNSAFRSFRSAAALLLLASLFFFFVCARAKPGGNSVLHNRKGTIQGRAELLSRTFIRLSESTFSIISLRFHPARSTRRAAEWISTRGNISKSCAGRMYVFAVERG